MVNKDFHDKSGVGKNFYRLFAQLCSEFYGSDDVFFSDTMVLHGDFINGIAGSQEIQDISDGYTGAFYAGFAKTHIGINRNSIFKVFGSHVCNLLANKIYHNFSYMSSLMVPAAYASLIMEGDVLWDRIVSIEYIGYEHVYDIEVEGTHNFIGNGIFAHNTYLTGNVGIGTTDPGSSKLYVNGPTFINGFLTMNSGITMNAGCNIQLINGAIKQDVVNSGGGAYLVHNADRYYYDLTSSARYKDNIRYNWTPGPEALHSFLSLSPAMWDYKDGMEKNAVSFISEDLAGLGIVDDVGRSPLVNYDSQNRPDSNRDYTLIALQHLILQDHDRQLKEQQGQIESLRKEASDLKIINEDLVKRVEKLEANTAK